MKAAYFKDYVKTLDEIIVGELPKPTLRPGHALVKVKAAAGNPLDARVANGFAKDIWKIPLPHILGVDFAGIVEAVGEGVTDFKAGDEVFGLNWSQKGSNGRRRSGSSRSRCLCSIHSDSCHKNK